jgi:hypothetical protein
MPSTRKPEQHGKKHAQPIQHTPYCTLSEELLEKFGLTERLELQTLKDFLSNTLQYGNESLKSGLENLFDGMEHAVSVYSKLIEEVNMLNNGIISLKLDANEAREQALLAETMTAQRSEVLLNHGFPTPIIRLTSQYLAGTVQASEYQLRHRIGRNWTHRITGAGQGETH